MRYTVFTGGLCISMVFAVQVPQRAPDVTMQDQKREYCLYKLLLEALQLMASETRFELVIPAHCNAM